MIVQTFYISTGRKNAMYTLRFQRGPWVDCYVCNLSTDEDKAAEKGQAYADAFRDRVGETEEFKVVFADTSGGIFERRGKLSTRDTRSVNLIENGVFPFGKHVNTKIVDAPDSYILFFADKANQEQEPVMGALSAACLGVALEKGLIAKREAVRAERKEKDELSQYVGTVGERRVFTGEVMYSVEKMGDMGYYYIVKVRCGDDIVSYMGSKELGKKGETLTFKATITKHEEYQGVKSTKVNRPAVA